LTVEGKGKEKERQKDEERPKRVIKQFCGYSNHTAFVIFLYLFWGYG
jgi:hypothetical protein